MTLATSKNLTLLGIATILAGLSTAAIALFDGDPATGVNIEALIGSFVIGIGFILSKGAKSTGGTVPETPEAAARVEKLVVK
jgi:hypothetical protein